MHNSNVARLVFYSQQAVWVFVATLVADFWVLELAYMGGLVIVNLVAWVVLRRRPASVPPFVIWLPSLSFALALMSTFVINVHAWLGI